MLKEDFEKKIQELEIFLDVIEENADSIMSRIMKRSESSSVSDDENIFLDFIEEDVSEIEKATKVIRDKVHQIRIMRDSLC